MEEEYLNLLRLFHAEGVEYVVVGGYAVIAHGFPRTTADLDLLVRPTVPNARRVVRALARFGYTQGTGSAAFGGRRLAVHSPRVPPRGAGDRRPGNRLLF